MAKYAVTHPGKMGDAMYTLPFIRYIYGATGEKVDFYTSDYCEPLRLLFEYQPCIDKFIIPQEYKVERMDMGCQPWQMPVPDTYEHVWQCGFKRVPDRALHQFIAHEQGVDVPLGIRYETNLMGSPSQFAPYVTIAPRGASSYNHVFSKTVAELRKRGIKVVTVGGTGDNQLENPDDVYVDCTGADMLTTAGIIKKSVGFIGLMSAMLVLANGFDIPRVVPHDNKSWDMRHVLYTEYNHYLVNPSADQIIEKLGVL